MVAIAVPTRAYAAVLIGTGITMARAKVPAVSGSIKDHFTHLCQLPLGTKVWLSERRKRHKGIIVGTEQIDGAPWVKIQTTTGDKTVQFVDEGKAANVQIEEWEGVLPTDERGQRNFRRTGFIEAVFAKTPPGDFVAKSRLDAVIVGSVARLQTEIRGAAIAAPLPNGRFVSGSFQDILRVRRFASGQAYRTEVVSDIAPEPDAMPVSSSCVAVFDGARAFLRQREALPSAHWVVVLDRTSAGFQDAVDAMNQEFMRRKADIPAIARLTGAPWGMEVMAFTVAA